MSGSTPASLKAGRSSGLREAMFRTAIQASFCGGRAGHRSDNRKHRAQRDRSDEGEVYTLK